MTTFGVGVFVDLFDCGGVCASAESERAKSEVRARAIDEVNRVDWRPLFWCCPGRELKKWLSNLRRSRRITHVPTTPRAANEKPITRGVVAICHVSGAPAAA